MWRFLEAVRSRPEQERKRFAFLVAGSVTSIIFFIWVITVLFSPEGEGTRQTAQSMEPAPSLSDTFAEFENTFSIFFQEFSEAQESIGSLDNVLNNSEQGATTTGDVGAFATSTLGTTTPDSVPVEDREEPENVVE